MLNRPLPQAVLTRLARFPPRDTDVLWLRPKRYMTEQKFETALERVGELVADFQRNEKIYLAPDYKEEWVRKNFIDKFWIALGWDVNNEGRNNPYEQAVKTEENVKVSGRIKKADYVFFAANFRDVRFFVEAKKPARNIDSVDEDFLAELDELCEELARSFKNRTPNLDGEDLTEATQRTLDRLVLMPFLKDNCLRENAFG